jgi:pyrroloquinoline quinone biosynthesis protein B
MQASIAVSADGTTWALFNATSDVRRQIESIVALQPRSLRHTPIAAVFLTDANVDHTAGLLEFRQAPSLRVVSPTPVCRTLTDGNAAFAPFARAPFVWDAIDDRPPIVGAGRAAREVRPIAVDGRLPSYAGGAPVRGAVTAYEIKTRRGHCSCTLRCSPA